MFGRDRIELKTPEQVLLMRRAGLVVADALAAASAAARPGATTADLDAVAAAVIADAGAQPSFLGYHDYPATICVSVNDEVVHGIPSGRVLEPGDVVSIDCGAIVDGWHGDSALTLVLPEADPADLALSAVTEKAMWDGIAALASGDGIADRLGVVGEAVEQAVEDAGAEANGGVPFGIVQDYVGHGIGSAMHQPPDVLNYRTRDRGPRLRPGMCLAVEPMITRGSAGTEVLEDDWTVVTVDASRAAHWEHSVALHEGGIWVLTAADGGAAELAARGVTVAPLG
ncbi:methionine aminopeptidase [Cellulomonas hominis]|uniref:Methionine aminopeptidase n=1 Tax=Cellulomonas hominis TaxID=156981 RepID=A0A511FI20_9CELL|nr:type I methionyl aminopeptidase [Cellulomonas hominis]MBB5473736.1 methionyl aminopeptidase [Cellulomonas hominis]NKY05943.1 type I methionyl aminopeptidase [Cellulomonas hominis]NKY09959.1 type I methionyl aminopeptidase [Cellulomonas hominis]GEL47468.1 methionine aminopeptidase [Cellulomonas hominis]